MTQQLICQGAEAKITLSRNNIVKTREKKSYRIKKLDEKLRKSRTKSEAKIISKLKDVIPVPELKRTNLKKFTITMQNIKGKKISENLEKMNHRAVSKMIAKNLTLMHDKNIVHGDLTTSNMIYSDGDLYFIDFGLSFHSHKIEDKAVDLHLIEQALTAKHPTVAEECFDIILNNYATRSAKETIEI